MTYIAHNCLLLFGYLDVIGCGPGYYGDEYGCECDPCPIGTYNNQDFAESCISCPLGWTTNQSSSTLDSHCRLSKNFILKCTYHQVKEDLSYYPLIKRLANVMVCFLGLKSLQSLKLKSVTPLTSLK